jgi:hypothetical protein
MLLDRQHLRSSAGARNIKISNIRRKAIDTACIELVRLSVTEEVR